MEPARTAHGCGCPDGDSSAHRFEPAPRRQAQPGSTPERVAGLADFTAHHRHYERAKRLAVEILHSVPAATANAARRVATIAPHGGQRHVCELRVTATRRAVNDEIARPTWTLLQAAAAHCPGDRANETGCTQ